MPEGDDELGEFDFGVQINVGDQVRVDYQRRGQLYPGKVSFDHHDGTYNIDYNDGDTEERVSLEYITVVDPDEDDWYDDFQELRQFSAAYMLKQSIVTQVRRRWACMFWVWRHITTRSSLARRRNATQMLSAISHLVTTWEAQSLLRGFWQWMHFCCEMNAQRNGIDRFKEDYATLVAHIHELQDQFHAMHHTSTRHRFQAIIMDWAVRSLCRGWGIWKDAHWAVKAAGRERQAELTLANENLKVELEDAQKLAAVTAKDKRRLMQELGHAQDEVTTVMDQLERAQQDARAAIAEVRELREKLRVAEDGGTSAAVEPESVPASQSKSRFSAFSAYSASLCADAGLDS